MKKESDTRRTIIVMAPRLAREGENLICAIIPDSARMSVEEGDMLMMPLFKEYEGRHGIALQIFPRPDGSFALLMRAVACTASRLVELRKEFERAISKHTGFRTEHSHAESNAFILRVANNAR